MKIETGICFNCGADEGLHHFETRQCPRHGIEETRFDKLAGKFYPQQWADTTFEDSGLRKLYDAAPGLLKVCQKAMESEIDGSYVAGANWWDEMKQAIKNAT